MRKQGIDDGPQATGSGQFAHHHEPRGKQHVRPRDGRCDRVRGTVHRRRLLLPHPEDFPVSCPLVPSEVFGASVMAAERRR